VPVAFPPHSHDHHGRDARRVPLALDTGTGGELRRPLGIAIIGGLLVSQVLTLYTTPVIYLYWDRLAPWWRLPRKTKGRDRGLPLGQEADE
jgi:hypothetical protein